VQSQSQATERAVNGLGAAVGKLAAAFSAIQAARFVFVQTAELEKQTRSLEVLTGSATKAAQIIKELKDIGAVTPFTSTELIDSAKRLQAFGVETNKVVETTRRLADVSGATGAELQGLVTAYGQVQAKGRLQGEELLQFQERGVALQQVLREEYKLSGEEFQDALSKGRISAEAVEYAIQKLTNAGGKYANGAIAQSDTLAGRLSTLQDAVQNLAQRLGTILAPAMQSILGLAIDIANQVNNVFETILLQRQLGANLAPAMRDQLFKQAGQEAEQIARLRGGGRIDPAQFTKLREERFRDLMRTYGYEQGILTPPTAAPPAAAATLPGLMEATGKGKGKGTDKAAREAERLAKEIARSLELGKQLGTQFTRQAALLFEANEIEKQRLQIQFDFEDRAKQISELKNAEQRTNLNQLNAEIQRLELIDLQTEALKKQAEEAKKAFDEAFKATEFGVSGGGPIASMVDEMRQSFSDFIAPVNQVKTAAEALGSAFSESFKGIVTGTKSAKEAIADFFDKIGQALIDYATQAIAQYIALGVARLFAGVDPLGAANQNLSGGGALSPGKLFPTGAFADGGFVTGPTNALIGEGGEPEYVIPASKMPGALARYASGMRGGSVIDGAVSDNRDFLASLTTAINGSAVDASESQDAVAATRASLRETERIRENRMQIMNQQSASERRYERERIEQMASTPGNLNIKYESQVINNVEYVTRDQAERMAAQSALRGRELAIGSLQNSVKTRKRVGIA
jgi:tape measure domain-containing protein